MLDAQWISGFDITLSPQGDGTLGAINMKGDVLFKVRYNPFPARGRNERIDNRSYEYGQLVRYNPFPARGRNDTDPVIGTYLIEGFDITLSPQGDGTSRYGAPSPVDADGSI
jgi:hypothetical protein